MSGLARRASAASAPARLAAAALAVFTALYAYYALALGAGVRWNLVPFALIPAAAAAAVALGGRWAAATVPFLLAGASLDQITPELSFHLARPGELEGFSWTVLALGALGVAFAAGQAAAWRPRTTLAVPATAGAALAALGALAVLAADPQGPLDGAPGRPTVVAADDFTYDRPVLRARTGEALVLRLRNVGGATHDLVIDELDVARTVPSGRDTLVRLRAGRPGSYAFYCSIRDHRELGMVGRLEVTAGEG